MKDEMDILQEVSSIAAAHGSMALSDMLKAKINLNIPNITTAKPSELFKKIGIEKPVISVQSKILTGTHGSVILILEEKSAFELINLCYTHDENSKETFTEIGFSVIKEIGNIVIGAYVGALSVILKHPIIPSIPTLVCGPLKDALSTLMNAYEDEKYVLLIEAFFEEADKRVSGKLYFVLTPKTVEEIQTACKKLLESISDPEK